MPKLRKPNHRQHGTQVTICGKAVSNDTICILPPHHSPLIHHSTIAITEKNALVAILRLHNDKEVVMWQLADPPE